MCLKSRIDNMSEDIVKINIAVLGFRAVGKKCLILRFVNDRFDVYSAGDIGMSFYKKPLLIRNKDVSLVLWIMPGYEPIWPLVNRYCEKADGILAVYNVTDFISYKEVSRCIKDLREQNQMVPITIVANKMDLGKKDFSMNEFEHTILQNVNYIETSAKTGDNVHEAFERMARRIFESKNLAGDPSSRLDMAIVMPHLRNSSNMYRNT